MCSNGFKSGFWLIEKVYYIERLLFSILTATPKDSAAVQGRSASNTGMRVPDNDEDLSALSSLAEEVPIDISQSSETNPILLRTYDIWIAEIYI